MQGSGKRAAHRVDVPPIRPWEDFQKHVGKTYPRSHFDRVFDQDTDVYDSSTGAVLARFRKGVFSSSEQATAREVFEEAAKRADTFRKNAVAADSGPHDPRNRAARSLLAGFWDRRDIASTQALKKEGWSGTLPNVICRPTRFTRTEPEKWKAAQPWLQAVAREHRAWAPADHRRQMAQAKKAMPQYIVPKTPFSTITVNYNWRTRLHVDAGDYAAGLGNLSVVGNDAWDGAYVGFPRFKVAFDVRPGDFLVMNVHEWHCNTAMRKKKPDAVRLSFVCYLREHMADCKRFIGGPGGISVP